MNKGSQTANRREFLAATTAAVAAPYIVSASALGQDGKPAASNRIVMAGIGIGNMGSGDQGAFLGHPDVQYVAVCDVRKGHRDAAKNRVNGHNKNNDCKDYVDFREIMARKDIDVVHCATPDHWHAIIVIEACKNGKDIYCQKPEARTLAECKMMVQAARRYGRVVSGGSQRVLEDYRGIVDKCWKGELGPIKAINVDVGPLSQPCNLPAETCPADMDWDMWLGPAPWAPYNSKRCDGNFGTSGNSWRSYIDYSGGGMTDWGAHHFGGATFAVDVREKQPVEVIFNVEGNNKYLTFRYDNGLEIYHKKPGMHNLQVIGTPGEKKEPKAIPSYKGQRGIYGDFIECVKTREKPFRDIELATNTVMLPLMGIIAYNVQRSLKWDAAKQEFIGDEEANRMVDRARREPWQL